MAGAELELEEESFPWHLGVYDAHCHPTDTVSSIDKIPGMKTRALTIMATRAQDQELVADFGEKFALKESFGEPDGHGRLVPAFGWHPWFSHQIYDDLPTAYGATNGPPSKDAHYKSVISPSPDNEDFLRSLPQPWPLSALLDQIRTHLERYPLSLIGLDTAFRIPGTESLHENFELDPSLTPGGRDGRLLSKYRVSTDHQRRILTLQLNLAGEMQRAVSLHGVAAHGVLYDTLRNTWRGHERPVFSKRATKRRASIDAAYDYEEAETSKNEKKMRDAVSLPFPPRICLHSYSGTADTLKLYLHPSVPALVFFSFSQLVNFSNRSNKAVDVIKAIPNDRILAESDLHAAGDKMDELMEKIIRKICKIKGWSLTEGVKQLGTNWMHYVSGDT